MNEVEIMRKKVEQRNLLHIIKVMTDEDKRTVAMGLTTNILKEELCRRELLALNLVDNITDVIKSYLDKPANLDNSEALIGELRQVLKVKED